MWSTNVQCRLFHKNLALNRLRILEKKHISLDSQSNRHIYRISYLNFLPEAEKRNCFRDVDINKIEHDGSCKKFVNYVENYHKQVLELRDKIRRIKELCSDDAVRSDNVDYEIIGSYAYYLKGSKLNENSLALFRTPVKRESNKYPGNIRFKARQCILSNHVTETNSELIIDFAELRGSSQFSNIKSIRISSYKDGIIGIIHDPLGNESSIATFVSLRGQKQFSTHLNGVNELHFMPKMGRYRYLRIFYTTVNDQKRSFRLYSGFINTKTGNITNTILLYEERNPNNYISLYRSKNGKVLFVGVVSFGRIVSALCLKSNIRLYTIPIPKSNRIFLESRNNFIYCVHRDTNGKCSYISKSNYKRLKPFRRAITDTSYSGYNPNECCWRLVGKVDCCVADIDMFDKSLVLYSLRPPSMPLLYVLNFHKSRCPFRKKLPGNKIELKLLNLPIKVGAIVPQSNSNYLADNVKLSFTCPGVPNIYCYVSLSDLSMDLQPQIRLSIKSLVYYVPSRDGKCKIPVTLVMRGDDPKFGSPKIEDFTKQSRKCIVYIYGTYGESLNLENYIEHKPLLAMGYILCFAHVRGGGELGKIWHDMGRKMMKHNSLYDLVDVIECLIAKNITQRNKLAISVSSASGIIGGHIYNTRPDLFSCMILKLPFMDLLDSVMDPHQPFAQLEYEEFGDPYNEDNTLNHSVLDYIYSYSPCSNVRYGSGPGLIIYCNNNDIRAPWYHSAKFAALSNNNRVYIKVSDYGHVGTPSFHYAIDTAAEEIAIMDELLA